MEIKHLLATIWSQHLEADYVCCGRCRDKYELSQRRNPGNTEVGIPKIKTGYMVEIENPLRIFAVVFEYMDYGGCKHILGIVYTKANSEEEARANAHTADILAVREISLEDFIKTGARA